MSDSSSKHPGDEDTAERALREGLRADRLSPEAMQRIRLATEAEWRAQNSPARRNRAWWAAGSAAMLVVAAALGVWSNDSNRADGAALGSLARVASDSVVEERLLRSDRVLAEGAIIHGNQSLDIRDDALVTLESGGNLRLARASSVQVLAANAVQLKRGELYVDIPPQAHRAGDFVVITPEGEFRHMGTQFAVAIVKGGTRVRVREGSIQWNGSKSSSLVSAGNEAVIDHDQKISRESIATTGREWAWVESLAPEMDIEGRPLIEFLTWFARESGRKLVLTDDAVRKQVNTVKMHGSIRGLTALEALSAVMAATSLQYQLPEGVIRVSSARAPTVPSS